MTRRSTRGVFLGLAALSLSAIPACRSTTTRPAEPVAQDVGDFFRRRAAMRPAYEPYPVYRPVYGQPSNPGGPPLNGYAGFNYPPLFGGRRNLEPAP